MEATAPVSADLEAVTDLVMKRQLIDVQRDHAKGIVKMVLECAAEAAGPVVPAYRPTVRRINVTVQDISLMEIGRGFCDHVGYVTGWDGGLVRRGSAYSAPSNTSEPNPPSNELSHLIGHNVALWVTDDEFFAMPTIIQFNDLGKPE
ncbi:hypothetical protein [Arthrobacter sp. UYCo732]|uniref:hypothetical protein n=1 Tax=Arthrobacter sp. UYCo732 TaxID=3156336 RepID=UPI003391000E